MSAKQQATGKSNGVFQRLLHYTGRYRLLLAGAVITALTASLLALVGPLLMGKAINHIVGPGQVEFAPIVRILYTMAGLYLVSVISQWLMSAMSATIAYRTARDIRSDAFARLSRLPLKFFDTRAHGDTISRFTNDIDAVADGLQQAITQLFAGVVTLLGTLGFMLYLSWSIALVVALVTPVSLMVARFIVKRSTQMFREQTRTLGELNGYVEEMVGGQRVVTAFGYEQRSAADFEKINLRLQVSGQKAQFYSSLNNPSTRLINHFAYVAVGGIGALMAVAGSMGVGMISSFLTYAVQFARPINEITGIATQLQNAYASAERVFGVMDQTEQLPDKPNAAKPQQVRGSVEFDGVAFSYKPEVELIKDLTLTVNPGETVAIVGPTGAGKTTIVNLLMRFYEVDEGAIRIDGVDIRDIPRDELRRLFGMVLQESWLFSGTVRENIAYARPDATEEQLVAAAKAAHAHSFIKRLPQGYDTPITEDGGNLSQGQKQLMTIARAMLSDPPMLILDEATSSVDTRTEQRIQKAFLALMQGRTSFVIAHRLSTIREADTILVMDKGHIIEVGSHDVLMGKQGFYYNLYNSQFSR